MASRPLQSFQIRIGYAFRELELLRMGLTHPSVAHESGSPAQHNQRLEFLGDAVLGLVLARELYIRYPGYDEGLLTRTRAFLVNGKTLADLSSRLAVGEHLILSRGEEQSGGRDRESTLADAFEALVGAIFLDGGFEAARKFVIRQFEDHLSDLNCLPSIDNPKGELQEFLQTTSNEPPQYSLTSSSGPDHDRSFECAVSHGGVELGRGQGKSKKAAETEAALAALRGLRQPASRALAGTEVERP